MNRWTSLSKTPRSTGWLTTHPPTNFFSCLGHRTESHGLCAFPILPDFCLFLSRYRPVRHHLAVDHHEQGTHRMLLCSGVWCLCRLVTQFDSWCISAIGKPPNCPKFSSFDVDWTVHPKCRYPEGEAGVCTEAAILY
jgi:hypothetical protein